MHDCFTRELKDGARPIDPDPIDPGQPLRCHRRRLRHRSPATELYQIKGFPYTLDDLLGDPSTGRHPSQRPLRDAAADLQHVSPLPCAARLPRRAGDLHLGRHLERQSDRAQAGREAVLQERARGDAIRRSPLPDTPSRWCRSRRSGGQHPAAFPRCAAATCGIAGRMSFPAMRH